MESLTELCDLVAQKPEQFPRQIVWICSRCPPAECLSIESPRVSRSQLNGIRTRGRAFLSKCRAADSDQETAKSLLHAFYRSIPASFKVNFWPHQFNVEAISAFYSDLLKYIKGAAEVSLDLGMELAGLTGDIVMRTISTKDSTVSRLVLDKTTIDPHVMEQVRAIAIDQLRSMIAFLKIRKHDWKDEGQLFKVRINRKLSVYQVAAKF